MIRRTARNEVRQRIHARIRKRLPRAAERPRLNIFRSLKHIYAQVVDDLHGNTMVAASSLDKDFPMRGGGNIAAAKAVGKLVAEKAVARGIKQVAFDRGGYGYHGRVKALADAAREGGLQF